MDSEPTTKRIMAHHPKELREVARDMVKQDAFQAEHFSNMILDALVASKADDEEG